MRGLAVSDLDPPEVRPSAALQALLTRGGWRAISFDAYRPGWRAFWHNGTNVCEGPVEDEAVLALFGPRAKVAP
jgi:hypothetical protein